MCLSGPSVGVSVFALMLSLGSGASAAPAKADAGKSEAPTKAEAKGTTKADTKGTAKADTKGKARAPVIEPLPAEDPADAAAGSLPALQARLGEVEKAIAGAEKIAADAARRSEAEDARKLVAGQLLLEDGDAEQAAITFLELTEAAPESPAGIQARFFLGEALYRLGMRAWALECFTRTLADGRADAQRYHQKTLARLLDLSAPRREAGFARRPGLAALPELRGRLRALGLPTAKEPPAGVVEPASEAAVVARIQAIAAEDRIPELRYAHGRWLTLRGEHAAAIAELDALNPTSIPLTRGGPGARWRLRAAYVAGVAALAMGEVDDALERFAQIIKAGPSAAEDRQILELAWLGRARVHHDRGDLERSLAAYRRIGRASPYYFTALYESAWVLLHAERFELAVQALDRVLALEPAGPLAPEVQQLRGKVKIAQDDLAGAEEAFEGLRQEFERQGLTLGASVAPASYFAAIAAADMEGFDLGGVIPAASLPIARQIPRARQAQAIAQEIGGLDRELDQLRADLARMESAVAARERARLFTDLGGQVAALERADDDLLEVMEALCARAGKGIDARALVDLEDRRKKARALVDDPQGTAGRRRSPQRRLDGLRDLVDELDAAAEAMRAELAGSERGFLVAAAQGKARASEAHVAAVIEMRQALGELERESRALRERIGRLEVAVRFDDPYRAARAAAVRTYRAYLVAMYAAIVRAAPDGEGQALWKRVEALGARAAAGHDKLDAAAGLRLERAITVLREERANLDAYRGELSDLLGRAEPTIGDVVAATYTDVAGEVANWRMRSEVGKLDAAFARKEAEARRAQSLERQRDRDQREIDRALEQAKEASQ